MRSVIAVDLPAQLQNFPPDHFRLSETVLALADGENQGIGKQLFHFLPGPGHLRRKQYQTARSPSSLHTLNDFVEEVMNIAPGRELEDDPDQQEYTQCETGGD